MPTPVPIHPVGVDRDQPIFVIHFHPDGFWRYRVWDQANRFMEGRLPTRDKTCHAGGSLVAAFLADVARLGVVTQPRDTQLDDGVEPYDGETGPV